MLWGEKPISVYLFLYQILPKKLMKWIMFSSHHILVVFLQVKVMAYVLWINIIHVGRDFFKPKARGFTLWSGSLLPLPSFNHLITEIGII